MSESSHENPPLPDGQDRTEPPGSGPTESLPPVEPPSAKLIAQLFFIPGLVVAVLVGLVWLFFGWLAPGSYEPQDFLKGLRSQHDPVRWRTAQDLAQILPRKEALRLDVGFALDLALLLEEECQREPPARAASDPGQAPHLAEFLPAALGHFHVPGGVPVLCRMIRDNVRYIEYAESASDATTSRRVNVAGLRVRNSLVALANLGGRLEELETLPEEQRHQVVQGLRAFASQEGRKGELAQAALQYWEWRCPGQREHQDSAQKPQSGSSTVPSLVQELYDALTLAVSCDDEMSRKFACLALANWPEPELEPLLFDLLRNDQAPRLLESVSAQRAILEIQYNAALGLLRRRSPRTPWRVVEELLDETALAQRYRDDSPQGYDVAAVAMVQLATLRTLYEAERRQPGWIREQPGILARVEQLQSSSNAAVQIEARRLLVTGSVSGRPAPRVSRELLLLIGVGLGVAILLAVAVMARWKRHLSGTPADPADVTVAPRDSYNN